VEVVSNRRVREVHDVVAGMIPQTCDVVMSANFDDDLILVIPDNLEILLGHIKRPHIVELVACSAVHVECNNELGRSALGKLELALKPAQLALGDATLRGLVVVN